VRGYNVVGKVQQAKLKGVFELATSPRMIQVQSASWWNRMCWA